MEEQFYLVWPLVMVGLLGLGRRRLPDDQPVAAARRRSRSPSWWRCSSTRADRHARRRPAAYWHVGGRSRLEDRHAVPVDDHPRRAACWSARRSRCCGGRGGDAWPAATTGPPARRHRRSSASPGSAVLAWSLHGRADAGRRRPVAVPRRLPRRRRRDRHGDRGRDPRGYVGAGRLLGTPCSTGSAPGRTGCTCSTGRSTRSSGASPATR